MRKKLSKVAIALSFLGVMTSVDGMNQKPISVDGAQSGNEVIPLSNSVASTITADPPLIPILVDDGESSDYGTDNESDSYSSSDNDNEGDLIEEQSPTIQQRDRIRLYAKYLHRARESKGGAIRSDWWFENNCLEISNKLFEFCKNMFGNYNKSNICPISDIQDMTNDLSNLDLPIEIALLREVEDDLRKMCIIVSSNSLPGNVMFRLFRMMIAGKNLNKVRSVVGMSAENYSYFKKQKEKEKDDH